MLDALEQALHERRPAGQLIHHSDRGSQYVSIKYTERLAEAGIEPSVGSVGDGIDKLTRIGRKWSSVGHCYPDAVAATQVAIALSLRWRSVQRLIRWRWTLKLL